MTDGTKFTISGADVAENQNRRRASTPAVAPIGTIGVRADGLQAVNFQRVMRMLECFPRPDPPLQPRRKPSDVIICLERAIFHDDCSCHK